jgi:PPOX class probable FMN-dependent enzyme
MATVQFQQPVTTADELAEIIGTPGPLSLKKELTSLDEHMRRFIAHSPFVVISTCDKDGNCDASPRGDGPGFVRVLDDVTLLVPDRPGNKRVDSMRNILQTGRIGMLFLVPAYGETLRVNGRAALIRDEAQLATMNVGGKRPSIAIAVTVEQCFLQCAKAMYRSKIWEPHERPDLKSLACAAEMLVDQAKLPEHDVASMQKLLDNAYANGLY